MSQSTISRRIKNLEGQLGVILIRRSTKQFELTDVGLEIYQTFKGRIDDFGNVIANIVQKKQEPSGTIKVVLPPVLSLDLITPHLPKFLIKYPKINLDICYSNMEIDLIQNGFDLAVINHIPKQQTQKIRNIYNVKGCLYCTPKYAKKYGIPKKPEDLHKHLVTGLMMEDFTIPNQAELIHKKTGRITVIDMPRRITVNNAIHAQKLMESNEVIGVLRYFDEMKGNIISILPNYYLYNANYYLIRHPNENDIKNKLFCDFLESLLK